MPSVHAEHRSAWRGTPGPVFSFLGVSSLSFFFRLVLAWTGIFFSLSLSLSLSLFLFMDEK